MMVGTIEFAVIPIDFPSSAKTRVKEITPAFAATYPPFFAEGSNAGSAPIDIIVLGSIIIFIAHLVLIKKLVRFSSISELKSSTEVSATVFHGRTPPIVAINARGVPSPVAAFSKLECTLSSFVASISQKRNRS